MTGHKHSPGAASQGENYPPHLQEIISIYKKIIKGESTETPTISARNYEVQNNIIGSCAPIGNDTNAPHRFSTYKENERQGHDLVKRKKESKVSSTTSSLKAGAKTQDGNSKKKKMKHAVQSLVKEKSQKKANLDEAVLKLANSATAEEQADKEHLQFQKDKWAHKKGYLDSKLEAKYQYKREMAAENKERIVLQVLKEDRDVAVLKYKEESDETLKAIFLEDVHSTNKLYKSKLNDFMKK